MVSRAARIRRITLVVVTLIAVGFLISRVDWYGPKRLHCIGDCAYDETLRAATDFDMWLRVAALRPRNCWCLPESLTL